MHLKDHLYNLAGNKIQSLYSQMKYSFGLKPKAKSQNYSFETLLYPPPFKACLVFSIDFELAWGWYRTKDKAEPLLYANEMACQTRHNFPTILALFGQYEIPATWAIVGHLFLERCARNNGKLHPEILRIPYFVNEYWCYIDGDWFDFDAGSDFQTAPECYAPDLIQQILDSKIDHEIACHTFSHIDLSDDRCPSQVADSELKACINVARSWDIELKSFIFPGTLTGNLASLKKYGFSAYRIEGRYELNYPRQDDLGLWQIPSGICIEKPFANWSNEYWVSILKRYIDIAIETGTVCHFWFHPSANHGIFEIVLPEILEYVSDKHHILWCATMKDLTRWMMK
jgi:hypothetical protein